MSDPQALVAALAELREADDMVQRLAHQLRSFADRMTSLPGETCFVDLVAEPKPPLDELMPGSRWYAAEFPTPDRLQAALRRRLLARQKALRLREELLPLQRRSAPLIPF